jgi:uncharacterized membrane protein YuzA (DUF378 family)
MGGLIGLMTYRAIETLFGNRIKAQRFINLIALTGTLFMMSFLILLKLSLLPIKYQ